MISANLLEIKPFFLEVDESQGLPLPGGVIENTGIVRF